MTTTPITSGARFAHAAALLAEHLADHALPEPAALTVTTNSGDSTVTALVRGTTVPEVAAELITWVDTLSGVTAEAWRPPERDRVHLSIRGTLTGPLDAVKLKVFGGMDYDPLRFADLQPDPCQGVPLPLGQLRTWAANHSPTPDTQVPDASRGAR